LGDCGIGGWEWTASYRNQLERDHLPPFGPIRSAVSVFFRCCHCISWKQTKKLRKNQAEQNNNNDHCLQSYGGESDLFRIFTKIKWKFFSSTLLFARGQTRPDWRKKKLNDSLTTLLSWLLHRVRLRVCECVEPVWDFWVAFTSLPPFFSISIVPTVSNTHTHTMYVSTIVTYYEPFWTGLSFWVASCSGRKRFRLFVRLGTFVLLFPF